MIATRRRFNANLQKVRIVEDGSRKRVNVCTRCLKADKVTKAA
jgi:large subunit ribosomal protein L28